jgi:ABC-type phosphate transport system substrate-binding protein
MMKIRLALTLAALSLLATALLPSNASAVTWTGPSRTFLAAGSSAQFNTMALAAGLDNAAGSGIAALCGEHHWTSTSSLGSTGAQLHDPRSATIPDEPGTVWVVWDDNFAAGVGGTATSAQQGTICAFVTVDSIVGNREYFANGTIVLNQTAGPFPIADGGAVPLLPLDPTGITQAVFNWLNGQPLNVALTDIRPEDAKFATIRALTSPAGTRIIRDSFTGAGYGPGPKGTPIVSSQSSKSADPVDFIINPGDTDPFTGAAPRQYTVLSVGASPVLVITNISNAADGHLGNAIYHDINRYTLSQYLKGVYTRTRDIAHVSGEPAVPIRVWHREPLSGTYNTMEFCIPLTLEQWPTFESGVNIGQETGVNPTNTSCTAKPCTVASGNPFYYIAPSGGTRGRVIGTGEMVSTVNSDADSLGYSFWGFSNFSGKTNTGYMTVDGIDPLNASPSTYLPPQCTALPCTGVTFAHIIDGSYPIWSVLRMIYDPTSTTVIATGMVTYAQAAASTSLPDFVPATSLTVFRSHFAQLVDDAGDAQVPHNGYVSGVPEKGGDMGGCVYTVQGELDYIADTSGNEQVNCVQ